MANTNPRNESNDWGRKHHIDGWRHLDGSLPVHRPASRKMPKRRHGIQNWTGPRDFDYPLTGPVLGALCAAVVFIAALSIAGWLP